MSVVPGVTEVTPSVLVMLRSPLGVNPISVTGVGSRVSVMTALAAFFFAAAFVFVAALVADFLTAFVEGGRIFKEVV